MSRAFTVERECRACEDVMRIQCIAHPSEARTAWYPGEDAYVEVCTDECPSCLAALTQAELNQIAHGAKQELRDAEEEQEAHAEHERSAADA